MNKIIRTLLNCFLLLCFLGFTNTQNIVAQFNMQNNLSRYAKVWGLIKYYHPEIAKGNIDWDSVLVTNIPLVKKADSKEKLSFELEKLFTVAGEMNICDTCGIVNNDSIKRYPDFEWVSDTDYFSNTMVHKLDCIIDNKYSFDNYYVQASPHNGSAKFNNEKAYEEMIYPKEEYRLLALFRYWNIIHYYYPYKHLLDNDWDNVLMDFIPQFVEVYDQQGYNLLISELTAKINDTHSITVTDFFLNYIGNNFLPFDLRSVENSTVITKVYVEFDSLEYNVLPGDIVQEINGISILKYRSNIARYIAGSNCASKKYMTDVFLSRIKSDSVNLLISRDDLKFSIKIPTLTYNEIVSLAYKYQSGIETLDWLSKDIAYINMAYLDKKDVDSIMQYAITGKAIIFDLRGYPRNTLYMISKYLNPHKTIFTLIYSPDFVYPGMFRYTKFIKTGPEEYNEDYYNGKVVLLVNSKTQSHGEFTCMALQTAPDVTIIGSQTSGADGNISKVILPGNVETDFSGIGIAYPDGKETQRIGIVPDIICEVTINGTKRNIDEVLERAISFINSEIK